MSLLSQLHQIVIKDNSEAYTAVRHCYPSYTKLVNKDNYEATI